MSEESSKPGGAPPFSAQDAMAFMQRMWNPFAMPMPGSTTGAVAPSAPSASAAQPEPESPAAEPASGSAFQSLMGGMMPGMLPFPNPAAMLAALDPAEIERKSGELRIIEGWLAMSLNMTQMSIKTLELQQASLEALQAAHAPRPKGKAKSKKD